MLRYDAYNPNMTRRRVRHGATRVRQAVREIVHCFPACIIVHLIMEAIL